MSHVSCGCVTEGLRLRQNQANSECVNSNESCLTKMSNEEVSFFFPCRVVFKVSANSAPILSLLSPACAPVYKSRWEEMQSRVTWKSHLFFFLKMRHVEKSYIFFF